MIKIKDTYSQEYLSLDEYFLYIELKQFVKNYFKKYYNKISEKRLTPEQSLRNCYSIMAPAEQDLLDSISTYFQFGILWSEHYFIHFGHSDVTLKKLIEYIKATWTSPQRYMEIDFAEKETIDTTVINIQAVITPQGVLNLQKQMATSIQKQVDKKFIECMKEVTIKAMGIPKEYFKNLE